MRALYADFMKFGPRPDLGLTGNTLPLGIEGNNPDLTMLQPNEDIIATDDELWAQGKAAPVERGSQRWWYIHQIDTWHDLEKEPLPAGTTSVATGAA